MKTTSPRACQGKEVEGVETLVEDVELISCKQVCTLGLDREACCVCVLMLLMVDKVGCYFARQRQKAESLWSVTVENCSKQSSSLPSVVPAPVKRLI